MAGAKEIKNRIKSIQSTRQITKAMEIVSTTKFKKFSAMVLKSRAYENGIKTILKNIASGIKKERHPLLDGREEVKSIGVLVFTADRGLCGGFNNLTLKELDKLRKEKEGKEITIIPVGRKAIEYSTKKKLTVAKKYLRLPPELLTSISTEISTMLVDEYIKGTYDEVYVIYNKFVSALRYDLETVKLLPIDKTLNQEFDEQQSLNNYIFEPDAETVLAALLPRFINVQVYQAMLNNMASEHSARKNAMSSATDSAEEMITELNLAYNRKRQASITQEITEIVGGASTI